MDMVFGHHPPDYFRMILFADSPDQIPGFNGYVAHEDRVAVFGNPNDVIGAIVLGMAGFLEILHIQPY